MHSISRLIPLRNNVSKCFFKAQNKNFCFYANEVTKKDSFDAFLQVTINFIYLLIIRAIPL